MTSTPGPASGASPSVMRGVTEAGVTHPASVYVTQDTLDLGVN